MRELAPQDELNKPRDHKPIEWVPAATWHCRHCDPAGPEGASSSVHWIAGPEGGQIGRCRQCGQKFELARPFEHLPELSD